LKNFSKGGQAPLHPPDHYKIIFCHPLAKLLVAPLKQTEFVYICFNYLIVYQLIILMNPILCTIWRIIVGLQLITHETGPTVKMISSGKDFKKDWGKFKQEI